MCPLVGIVLNDQKKNLLVDMLNSLKKYGINTCEFINLGLVLGQDKFMLIHRTYLFVWQNKLILLLPHRKDN